jgi:hypothetical protein
VAAELADRELAIKIPDGQTVGLELEFGVRALLVLQRVDVGHQVAPHPVRVDQLHHAGALGQLERPVSRVVGGPAQGQVGHAQRQEDFVVEAVLPEDQVVHHLQELTRGGALDDAVVVGGSAW